jgi:hypothetical protein
VDTIAIMVSFRRPRYVGQIERLFYMRSSDKGPASRSFWKNEFGIRRSTWRSDCLDRNAWSAKLHIGKKSAMKQWLLREESKHIGRHDACNIR